MCALDHMRKRRSISVLAARLVRPPTYLDRSREGWTRESRLEWVTHRIIESPLLTT